MKLASSGTIKKALVVLGVAYLTGTILYAGHLGWTWYTDGEIPNRPLWMHLLAPLTVVALWLGMEALGTFVGNGFTFDDSKQSKWRRVAGLVGMFILLACLLIGIPIYHISKGG